jgi:hypothetical protein
LGFLALVYKTGVTNTPVDQMKADAEYLPPEEMSAQKKDQSKLRSDHLISFLLFPDWPFYRNVFSQENAATGILKAHLDLIGPMLHDHPVLHRLS